MIQTQSLVLLVTCRLYRVTSQKAPPTKMLITSTGFQQIIPYLVHINFTSCMIVPQSFQSVDLSNSLTYFLSKKQVDGLVHRKSTAVLHRLQMDWYLGKAQLSYTGCRRTGTWGKHSCSTQAADGLVPGESTAVLHRLQTDWYLGKAQLSYTGCRRTGTWGNHSCCTQAVDGLVPGESTAVPPRLQMDWCLYISLFGLQVNASSATARTTLL